MRNKLLVGMGLILTVLGIYLVILSQQEPKDANAGTIIRTVDILGTGTTTAGTYNFGATAATTTSSAIVLGSNVDIVDFDIHTESASTTAHVGLQILESSLPECALAGPADDYVDAIALNTTSGKVTTITTGTSTILWSAVGGSTHYQLKDVNAHCMKVVVGGKDVNLYIRANLKTNSF